MSTVAHSNTQAVGGRVPGQDVNITLNTGLPGTLCLLQKLTNLPSPFVKPTLPDSTWGMGALPGDSTGGCNLFLHTALPWTQFPRPEYLTSGQPPHLTAPPLHLFSIPSSLPSPGHRPSSASYYFSSPTLKSFFPDLASST